MKIIFLITFILLFFSLIFIKKNNDKKNIVITSIFTIDIIYCTHLLLTFILSIFGIKCNFLVLSIVNLTVVLLLVLKNYYTYKKIEIQKYLVNLKEIICLVVIAGICITIGLVRFNDYKDIVYETTDPTFHHKAAVYYAENLELLTHENSKDQMYGSFNHSMTGFYVNCGLFIRTFDNIPSYQAYMIYDIMVLFLLASTFYITSLQIKRVNNNNFLLLLITCLYFGAYCLNDVVFGFGYLGVGILTTNLILFTWILIEEEKNINTRKILYCLLFLFNYSLFFSYYFFVPVLYLAQGLYIIFKWIKHENTFKEILKIGIFTLILPFIIGIIYFMLPGLVETGETVLSNGLANEGYIYRDLWSNLILVLPLVIYSFILELKKKNINSLLFTTIIEIIFIIGTFLIGMFAGKISSYYFFKSYYILWLLIYLYIVKLVNCKEFNVKSILRINIYFIVFILGILVLNVETKIQEKNILFNNTITSPSVANIYWFNAKKILEAPPILTNGELEIIEVSKEYYDDCIAEKKELPLIGNYMQKLWYYSITDVVPVYKHKKLNLSQFYENNFDIKEFESDSDAKCLIIFNRENNIESENYIAIDTNNYLILFENEYGKILKKN